MTHGTVCDVNMLNCRVYSLCNYCYVNTRFSSLCLTGCDGCRHCCGTMSEMQVLSVQCSLRTETIWTFGCLGFGFYLWFHSPVELGDNLKIYRYRNDWLWPMTFCPCCYKRWFSKNLKMCVVWLCSYPLKMLYYVTDRVGWSHVTSPHASDFCNKKEKIASRK